MNIAYVRVSTIEQNEARQLEALKKYNVAKLIAPKIKVPIAMDLYPSLCIVIKKN